MKKFQWPLERLLRVTEQRERAMRLEAVSLQQQAAILRRQAQRRQALLRTLLEELGSQPVEERIARQEVFMRHSRTEERAIANLLKQVKDLERRREEVLAELMRLRTSRKSLERLREEAFREYQRGVAHEEQKQLDESAGLAYVARRGGTRPVPVL